MKILLIILLSVLLQSCNTIPADFHKTDCSNAEAELEARYALFPKLSEAEIAERHLVNVPTDSKFDELSVFSKLVSSVKSAEENAKFVAVDLRHYHNVALGNIVISNVKSKLALKFLLKNMKFSQGYFSLINFGKDEISIFPPKINKIFAATTIPRGDLNEVEAVFNVSDSNFLISNMKFSEGQKVSIIANRVKKPFQADFREASNLQFHLDNKWVMSVYSIEDSFVAGGKDTGGFFKFVNNKGVKQIQLVKFDKSIVKCHLDPLAPILESPIRKPSLPVR